MLTLPDAINDECKKLLKELISWLVQPSLDYIRHNCKLFLTTSPLHLVRSLLSLFTCLLDEVWVGAEEEGKAKIPHNQVFKYSNDIETASLAAAIAFIVNHCLQS